MQLLLQNSDGKPSLSFTMVYTAFFVSLLWYTLSIFKVPHIKDFDMATVSGFLTPLMALYFGRRWNDTNNPGRRATDKQPTDPNSTVATTTPTPASE